MISSELLEGIRTRFREVTQEMSRPEVAVDPERMARLGREHASLRDVVKLIEEYSRLTKERSDLSEMVDSETDDEIRSIAETELEELEERLPKLESELRYELIPKDPEDSKDVIVEIRAGTGGDEAALFAGDLFRLSAEEHALFEDLRHDRIGERIRLEQERIGYGWLRAALADLDKEEIDG